MDEPEETQNPQEKVEETKAPTLVELNQEKQAEALVKLINEDDLDKVKDLTHLFNVYQAKRNALRINALNDVQDALVQQMIERLTKYPDNFNNKDISDWMKTIQAVMESSNEKIAQVDTIPAITYQQNNQVNVNISDTLSRESREKVVGVIEALLRNAQESADPLDESLTEIQEASDTDDSQGGEQ